MSASPRSALATADSALTYFEEAAGPSDAHQKILDQLIELSEQSNGALMRGNLAAYLSMISFTQDFTLMSPFGGRPTHGHELTDERLEAMGRFFRHGTLTQEVVAAYGSQDMAVLALIERATVEVGGLPLQEWALRVTLVYRREANVWKLAHRHADPLAGGITLTQAAALAEKAR